MANLKVVINSIASPNINITIKSKYPDMTTNVNTIGIIRLDSLDKFDKDLKKFAKDYIKGKEDDEIKIPIVDAGVTALIGTTIDYSNT
jgi:hypothetical protein